MDMKHLLKADGEQVHLADQCNSRPAGEVAVDVLTASSMTCAEHARHLVLAAADGRVLAPWVNGVVERGDEVGSGDVLLIYAAWVRSLALGQVSSISGEGDADLGGVDWLLHGLAYVEGMTKGATSDLLAMGSPFEALRGALAVITTTIGLHASAMDQSWAMACEQLTGIAQES